MIRLLQLVLLRHILHLGQLMLIRMVFASDEGAEAAASHSRQVLFLKLVFDSIDLQILVEIRIGRLVQHQIIDHLLLVDGALSLLENVELIFG